MKKLILFLTLAIYGTQLCGDNINYYFCAGGYNVDENYYNLFMQELVNAPQYSPFLRSNHRFYSSEATQQLKNENIEEWQDYLGVSYKEAHYLVFKASRKAVEQLLNHQPVNDPHLAFADVAFVNRHKQALLYLAYAKYLAPYMKIINPGNYGIWGQEKQHTVAELDYQKVVNVLKRSWQAETDKELKLRYGYQLVRFAHYYRKYQTAIQFFKQYVAPLNYKPAMYYYALAQKAGAEKSLGLITKANVHFFTFFMHTKNRKKSAYKSMHIESNADLQQLLQAVKGTKARNDVYLLLGYNHFNNPLSSFYEIVKTTPNAVQAKLLMARAINQIERQYFTLYYNCSKYRKKYCNLKNKRIPIIKKDTKLYTFLQQTIKASAQQASNPAVNNKAFWNLTTAYLYFVAKNYPQANAYLNKVHTTDKALKDQKKKIQLLVLITEQNRITPQSEDYILKTYRSILNNSHTSRWGYNYGNSTGDFVKDIIANRYFLQGNYAKSFLIQNKITALEMHPNPRLVKAVAQFIRKKDKNNFEKYLLQQAIPSYWDYEKRKYINVDNFNFKAYIAQMEGTLYLAEDQLQKALTAFQKVPESYSLPRYNADAYGTDAYNGYAHIPRNVFGNRPSGDFGSKTLMKTAYIDDFSFIPPEMNKYTLTKILIRLEKIAQEDGTQAAKACYLLSNFFYNTTTLGFYRQLLTFDLTNANGRKFHNYAGWKSKEDWTTPPPDWSKRFYFKNYNGTAYYPDNFKRPLHYAKEGLSKTHNKAVKAHLLFAAAQCNQGLFYQKGGHQFAQQTALPNSYSSEYYSALVNFKATHYRPYFNQLKVQYKHTDYYTTLQSYCKYFSYYVTHY